MVYYFLEIIRLYIFFWRAEIESVFFLILLEMDLPRNIMPLERTGWRHELYN